MFKRDDSLYCIYCIIIPKLWGFLNNFEKEFDIITISTLQWKQNISSVLQVTSSFKSTILADPEYFCSDILYELCTKFVHQDMFTPNGIWHLFVNWKVNVCVIHCQFSNSGIDPIRIRFHWWQHCSSFSVQGVWIDDVMAWVEAHLADKLAEEGRLSIDHPFGYSIEIH
jgi:hypothetical protein